jgi:hypothetical protein
MNAKVMTVKQVDFHLTRSKPPFLLAQGEVPTGGWSNGQLSPYVYLSPPKDGIWDFDFIAEPPSGLAVDVVSAISASIQTTVPKWFKGVRVHAATNSMDGNNGPRAKQPGVFSFIPIPWATGAGASVQGGHDVFPWTAKT